MNFVSKDTNVERWLMKHKEILKRFLRRKKKTFWALKWLRAVTTALKQ